MLTQTIFDTKPHYISEKFYEVPRLQLPPKSLYILLDVLSASKINIFSYNNLGYYNLYSFYIVWMVEIIYDSATLSSPLFRELENIYVRDIIL